MSNKVERLAAMMDDKTLISSLIRDCSDRIKLIEFKDARADIWQYFRLVQIDGQTLSYAVCVRCMKPVSYKAREGTGGLHRHPCSKAVQSSSMVGTDLSINSTSNSHSSSVTTRVSRTVSDTASTSTAHSNSHSSRSTVTNNLNKSNLATMPTAVHVANLSMNSLLTANLATNFPFNFPEIKYEQSLSSPEHEDEAPALRLLETSIKELIPWTVTNNSLNTIMNDIWQLDQGFSSNAPSLEPLLTELYRKGYHKVREEISTLGYLPIIVDIWSTDHSDRFATLWISFEHKKQILKTIDISLVDNFEQLITELDKARILFCSPLQKHVYIFDNDFRSLVKQSNEEYFLCPLHELDHILDEALLNNSEFPIVSILRKVQQHCNMKANFLSEIIKARSSNWFERFSLLKLIRETSEVFKEFITGDNELELILNDDIWNFFQPYHDAMQAFSIEPSMNVVTLWKAKLDDHCKPRDSDSSIIKSIKNSFNETKHPITPTGLISVCLDPRFKKLKMLDIGSRERTYAKLRQMIGRVDGQKSDSNDSDTSSESHNTKRKKTSHLLTSFNEYMDDSNENDKDELDRYLEIDVGQATDLEPNEFWSGEFGNKFPRLAIIAKQLIIDTPTVPPSCQLHSKGRQFSKRRSVLTFGQHMDEILLLHSLFTT